MADATRLQTLSKQNYERKQHSDELDRLFASLEASWTKTLSQGSWNSPIHIQEVNSSSNTITVHPRPPLKPQQSTNGNDKIVAHQLFDQMPNEYQKDLAVISNKEVLPFSHKEFNSSPSDTLNTYPRPPQPPDPPDCKSHTEFPKFDGTLLREWLRHCDEYFYRHKTPPEMKVRVASPHMIGKALEWHTNYIRNNFGMLPSWLDYTIAITAQFGDNDALPMHRAPFSPYQNQNNQSHYNIPNTTSLLPPLETTKSLPYKPNFPPETNMEKSQILQESGMRGLGMPSDGSYANGNHLESKKPQIFVMECENATISGDETNVETNSLLEKETISSSALCEQDSATQSQDFNVIQQEKLIHDTETIMEMGPIQEPESLGLTDSIFKVDFVPSQFQVPIPSLEPSCRRQKESLAGINDQSCDFGCVISKTNGCICDSELVQANFHDEKEFKGLNLGKLLRDEWLLDAGQKMQSMLVCLLGLNDMSCWTQLLRQQIIPKSWRFKFKTESRGEVILLNTYRAVCLGCCCYEYKNQMLLLGYHGLGVQVLSSLQEFGDGSKTDTSIVLCWKKFASFLWFLHGKKLLGMGVKQLTLAATKFHLKHKWRSRLEFCVKTAILFTSSVKLLFPKNHKLLHYEAEFCAQYNDLEQLRTESQSSPGLDYFAYLIFLWNQALNCGCEAGHISCGFFSVGDVHEFFTCSKLENEDETQSKRLLVLNETPLINNDNKGDITIKENWFHSEPMIRGVYHLQRPPELIKFQGNPNFFTKVLVQWKEHPPDQFFSGFYGQVLLLSSLRPRMLSRRE